MKKIKLTQNKYTLVDNEDYEYLNQFKWYALKEKYSDNFYAARALQKTIVQMHRIIMNPPKGMIIDHVDGNGLNNQRSNLRICTHSQNSMNSGKRKNNTSGYKGVSFNKREKKFKVTISVNTKAIHLGYYDTALKAYEAYCRACEKYHGEFKKLK